MDGKLEEEASETPFMNFMKRATNKVKNTTKNVITQMKEGKN